MSLVLNVLSGALLALGCFVALTSALGLYRLPDFFSRMHAAGKTDTLAQQLIVAALILQAIELGAAQPALKLVLISGFLFITTPASTHAIARAAHIEGLEPWKKPEPAPEPRAQPSPGAEAQPAAPGAIQRGESDPEPETGSDPESDPEATA